MMPNQKVFSGNNVQLKHNNANKAIGTKLRRKLSKSLNLDNKDSGLAILSTLSVPYLRK